MGREGVTTMRRRKAVPFALAAFLATAAFAGATPTKQRLHAKEAEAQSVLAQVNALDSRFEASVEAWHGAQYELGQVRTRLQRDRAALRVAERARRIALARVRARLVALYEGSSSANDSTLGILLGSSSLSDVLDRLNAAHQIAAADHRLAVQTTAARDRYARLTTTTQLLVEQKASDVAQLASQRRRIGSMLDERKRLLASVQSEVSALRAQEAHQQAVLAAQARARLEAIRRAAELAAAAKKAQHAAPAAPAPAPTTTTAAAAPATTAPTTTSAAPPPPQPGVSDAGPGHPEAATIAMRYLGIPYQWGGASPSTGFDCSGLVMYVYAQIGIMLPHFAAAQYAMGTPVARDQLEPGDLVFFDNLDHVGIYIGGGQMIHAPHTGDVVKISPLSDFGAGYVGARRL